MEERGDSKPMIHVEKMYQATPGFEFGTQLDEQLNELIQAYSTDVFNLAYSYVRDFQQAQDLAQEVFLRAYRNLDRFHGLSSYKTWLYSITANCCRDYLRAQKVRRMFLLKKSQEPVETASSAESQALTRLKRDALWKAVMQLPVKYREVVILHYKEDLSLQQIADILSITEQTARTRLFRAREQLRTLLKKEDSFWTSGNND